ncbi:DEAD/DEAH box helicase [Caldichromatium japonicum]|uniref:ATP-dependent RNA helicase RhlB n=1 Tax=Caldichromatium japonicum TaxID=2699430 RepID=A0A6G7VC95_9GAMM|nr:DEAD/DEAH box helicase [Caldichromatium japonicum]QIK37679.1 DEAD/DEAH box helicase [Caldichromatium japonicum]
MTAATHLTSIRFDTFALDARILAGLNDAGFVYCTPIQAEILPLAFAGQDVAGQAQTGTGKTAAFLVALMQHLLSRPRALADTERCRPRALVMAPTRELAVQIHKDTQLLAGRTGLRSTVVFGGTGYQQQREALAAGVDILIGTPGRLIDYYKQQVFDLKGIEVVVLDEADRMFDLGFIKDIRYLFRQMPPPEQRLGMLFSATLSYRVTELAYEHMNQPRLIKIEAEQVTAENVRQVCYLTANDEKIPLLIGLIRSWPEGRVIVFVNTKREADRVWGHLQGNGIEAAVLSGDVPQPKRLRLLREFTQGRVPVLVATDVAARGLHIPDVTHVVNYDLPEDLEDYVHRIGRTARAGASGDAVSFVCETYAFCLPDIEQYIGSKIPIAPLDPALLVPIDPHSRRRPEHSEATERLQGRRERKIRKEPPVQAIVSPATAEDSPTVGAEEATVTPQVAPNSETASRRPVVQWRFRTLDEHFFDQLVDEWPERIGPEIEIPDMPLIRRIRRTRGQLEPSALTSPPLTSAPPTDSAAASISSETRASKRRRRRRRPGVESGSARSESAPRQTPEPIS